jgi:hypothetical protein
MNPGYFDGLSLLWTVPARVMAWAAVILLVTCAIGFATRRHAWSKGARSPGDQGRSAGAPTNVVA